MMKELRDTILKLAAFGVTVFFWLWLAKQQFPPYLDAVIIVGAILLVFPVVILGRWVLEARPTEARAAWITACVHFALMLLLGMAIARAVVTRTGWRGWVLPVPERVGYFLVVVTSLIALLTVINLAWKGLGAPFALALTRRLSVDWMYAWTRNPMVLATLACLLSLGIWFQSALFVLWVLILVTPAWIAFVKIYEERELEIRFGASYLEYRARTPLLLPRRPRS
jgi:protein-S-isoprenylcysteine O-methyltransferase Ste14